MNCYNHPEYPAVGICKSCHKGLCKECAVDTGNGLACNTNCEEEVKAINELLTRGMKAYQKTGKAYKRMALIYGLMGFISLLLSILLFVKSKNYAAFMIIPLGVIFLIGAFLTIKSAKQISSVD